MMTKVTFSTGALALALLLPFSGCGSKSTTDTLPSAPAPADAEPTGHEGHEGGEAHEGHQGGEAHEGHGGREGGEAHEGHEGHEGHEAGGEHHHGAAGGPIDKFHEQLAPLWHAPESPKRVADTCAAAATLHGLANDIVMAGAGEGTKPDYLDATHKLVETVAALHKECGTADRKDFAAKFGAVHEAFHAVAERAAR
jgi:hypothetical protein